MAQAAIAANVHQTFDVQLYLRTELTFGFVVVSDDPGDRFDVIVRPLINFGAFDDTGFFQNRARSRRADDLAVGQSDDAAFVTGQVNTCNTCHIMRLVVISMN